jgi:hypothetical protein
MGLRAHRPCRRRVVPQRRAVSRRDGILDRGYVLQEDPVAAATGPGRSRCYSPPRGIPADRDNRLELRNGFLFLRRAAGGRRLAEALRVTCATTTAEAIASVGDL